jgi:nucleotidyltransferase/DNA polymerase involved in DNA repair
MSEEAEPASKKAKTTEGENGEPTTTGWENHTLNISEALMKDDEGRHLADVTEDEVSTLQGIGSFSTQVLKALDIKTIGDLATYKYFLLARALKTLAEAETKDGRLTGSVMNVDKAVDKAWETKSLKELCEAPTEALEGIAEDACELLESLGVKSIGDLAEFKYCRWAEAIVLASKYEENMTSKERKLDSALKKLK